MNTADFITSEVLTIQALVSEAVTVTSTAADVRPALEAGQIVIWVTFPDRITMPGNGAWEIEMTPLLLAPTPNAQEDGATQLLALVHHLEDHLGITSVDLDSLQIGSGPYWPAARIHYDQTITD